MLSLEKTSRGIILRCRISPNAKKNRILGWYQNSLKIAVTAPPEKNRANKLLLKYLAKELGLKASQVILESGAHSRDKRILFTKISLATLKEKLSNLILFASPPQDL